MLSIHKLYVKPVLSPGKGHVMNCLQRLNAGASWKLEAGIVVASWKLLHAGSCGKLQAAASCKLQATNSNGSWK